MTNSKCKNTALHTGISVVSALKSLHYCSISFQSLTFFSEKDLPKLRLGKVKKVLFMNPYI